METCGKKKTPHLCDLDSLLWLNSLAGDYPVIEEGTEQLHVQGMGKSPTGSSQVDVVARHTSLDDDSLVTQLGDRLLRAEVLSHQHLDQQASTDLPSC